MRSTREWAAAIGLAALAVYCGFALLFTKGGIDAGGVGGALMFWVGAIGGAAAVLGLVQGSPVGRWVGLGVYSIGAICFSVYTLISTLAANDRLFLLAIAAANALGVLALYKPAVKLDKSGRQIPDLRPAKITRAK